VDRSFVQSHSSVACPLLGASGADVTTSSGGCVIFVCDLLIANYSTKDFGQKRQNEEKEKKTIDR